MHYSWKELFATSKDDKKYNVYILYLNMSVIKHLHCAYNIYWAWTVTLASACHISPLDIHWNNLLVFLYCLISKISVRYITKHNFHSCFNQRRWHRVLCHMNICHSICSCILKCEPFLTTLFQGFIISALIRSWNSAIRIWKNSLRSFPDSSSS